MKCWHCEEELIWGNDHSYDDYGIEGEGIVTNLNCPNSDCGVSQVLVYLDCKKEDK